jgi:hypothetical protein
MIRPTSKVGQQPHLWLLLMVSFRKCFKLRYLLSTFVFLTLLTYLRLITHAPSDETIIGKSKSMIQKEIILLKFPHLNNCDSYENQSLLHYASSNSNNDTRPKPTIQRLQKLFRILISYEDRYEKIFDYLNIFRFNNINNTLLPYVNNTQRLHNIYCSFQHYLPISDHGQIEIKENFIDYLKQISNYLSDGFRNERITWNQTPMNQIQKPVIILAANANFYETLQASMRTVNTQLLNYSIAIYDLGFKPNQLDMIKQNCERCIIIPFPFTEFEYAAPHVRILSNFAWKPLLIQVEFLFLLNSFKILIFRMLYDVLDRSFMVILPFVIVHRTLIVYSLII